MSETAPEPTPTPQPAQDEGWSEAFAGLTPAEVKEALDNSRKWESRSKANKTELDKAIARAAELEAQNGELSNKVKEFETKAERSKTIAEVAKEAGVPADALRGDTREELEAHAEVLKALIKPSGPVIPGQEKAPNKVGDDPLREFTRNLFQSSND